MLRADAQEELALPTFADSTAPESSTRSPGLVSCIVPVYNGERYLAEALDSILGQSHQPLQVIVVDDGSTDGTAAVAARYGERVEYYRQPNAGAATARNLGLSLARGEFVAFLDADDLWHSDKLRRQVARFQARPELEMCLTHAQNFWVPELREEQLSLQHHPRAQAVPGYSSVTLLARHQLFEAVGSFNTALRLGESIDWFVRAAEYGAVVEVLPDVLVYRRVHSANSIRRRAVESRREYLAILKASLDRRRARCTPAP
jgi:glycosyltransferase involved in cell wall biosynthesis